MESTLSMARSRSSKLLWERAIILALLLTGAVLRMAGLGQVPPGLYHDEAQNGVDATHVLEGELKLYFEANNGREPLFIYLTFEASS